MTPNEHNNHRQFEEWQVDKADDEQPRGARCDEEELSGSEMTQPGKSEKATSGEEVSGTGEKGVIIHLLFILKRDCSLHPLQTGTLCPVRAVPLARAGLLILAVTA